MSVYVKPGSGLLSLKMNVRLLEKKHGKKQS